MTLINSAEIGVDEAAVQWLIWEMNPSSPVRGASALPRGSLDTAPGASDRRYRSEEGSGRALTPFVGRRNELALLGERLAQARAGHGQIVLLVGEPGVGKSRLLLEFERSLEAAEVCWLTSRAVSHGTQMAYLPVIDLVKRFFRIEETDDPATARARIAAEAGALGEEMRPALSLIEYLLSIGAEGEPESDIGAEQRRVMTFEALRNLLLKRAQRCPLIVVVEDLHWIDQTSEEFLVWLADSLSLAPVLMLLTYRREYRHRFPERSFISHLTLQHLTEQESVEMAGRVLTAGRLPNPLRDLILAKAEGNPFFVEELIKSLLESGALTRQPGKGEPVPTTTWTEIPNTIQDVILRRIDRLDPRPRKALQLASVIGREFALALLETIAGTDEPLGDLLNKLKDFELIYERSVFPEHTCIFKHALTQEAAYNSLLPQRRKELHRLVAAAIEKLYGSRLSDFYGLLAHHYQRGEEWEHALDYLQRAAQRCREIGAYREEALQLSQAMTIAEQLGRAATVNDLRGQRGIAWVKCGRWRAARPDLEVALPQVPRENRARRAELLSSVAGACFWDLDIPSMEKYVAQSQALLLESGSEQLRNDLVAGLLAWRGARHQAQGNLVEAAENFERALAKGGGFCAAALAMYPMALCWQGRTAEALARATESAQAFRGLSDVFAATFGHPHLGLVLATCGRYTEAARAFEEAKQMAVKHELGSFLARALAMSAGFHLDVFDYEGNERLALETCETARSVGFQPSLVSANIDLVFNYTRRGELAQAQTLQRETAAQVAQIGGWHQWLWDLRLRQTRAEIACASGNWSEALRLAHDAAHNSHERGRPKYEVAGLETSARALAALGRKNEAIAELRKALQLARPTGDPALFLRASITLLALDGDDALLAEAQHDAARIVAELPTEEMRQRFRVACEESRLCPTRPAPEAGVSTTVVMPASPNSDASFQTTQWSVVLQAGAANPMQARSALNRLCETYWYPLYVFARRQGHNPDDARDLVQDFFALVLERDYFQEAERAQGSFRSFLLMAFKRFLANGWERTLRPKRAEAEGYLLLDYENTEARYTATGVAELPAERAYEHEWAVTLLAQVMERLQSEFAASGNAGALQELHGFLNGDGSPAAYAEAGRRLGLSRDAVGAIVQQLRTRYRELLRAEIANTVTNTPAVEHEIRNLSFALS